MRVPGRWRRLVRPQSDDAKLGLSRNVRAVDGDETGPTPRARETGSVRGCIPRPPGRDSLTRGSERCTASPTDANANE